MLRKLRLRQKNGFLIKKPCMLVKKIKWVNDVGKFAQGSSIEGRFKEQYIKNSISKFSRPHKLADKLSC